MNEYVLVLSGGVSLSKIEQAFLFQIESEKDNLATLWRFRFSNAMCVLAVQSMLKLKSS